MRPNFFLRLIACLAAAAGIAAPALAALPAAPVAKQIPVVDDYFGTKVTDPYRWMEQPDSPDLQTYLKAQNDRTRAILDSVPGRKEIAARVTALSQTVVASTDVSRRGDLFFYQKTTPDSSLAKLYVRSGIGGAERVLLDPATFAKTGPQQAIAYYIPSDDGKYVAVGIAAGGTEDATARVIETATGKLLPDAVTRARFGVTSWRADGAAFYYARMQALPANAPVVSRYQNVRTYVHVLGQDPEKDIAIFGTGVNPNVKVDPNDFAFGVVSTDTPYAVGILRRGVQNEVAIFVAPKAGLDTGKANWKQVVDYGDDVTDGVLHDQRFYLLSHKNALRFKVIATDVTNPNVATAQVVVAPSDRVIAGIAGAKDALYVQSLQDGLGRIARVPWGGAPTEIPLPVNGTVGDLSANPDSPGFLTRLQSWTVSPLWYAYNPANAMLVDTKLDAASPVNYSNIVSEEVKVRGRDGTMIPLSIVHRKDLPKDGSSPTLLYAYGSYGINSNPSFSAIRMAWFERGGVTAIAHVRGGGEYGEEWHIAGKDANKINTINDYIDCAKWLIDQKYTSPGKLGGLGGSAGGITMGGAIDNAPELFAAILDAVPVSDQLRIEFSANGPPNIPEFGSVKTPQGFKNLYATSAIHHLTPGGKYPAVMVSTGANDPRVDPWQAAKMAASLQADSGSGKPILLRVEFEGGHGFGETKEQQTSEITDQYTFLLWNMGVAGFQPAI